MSKEEKKAKDEIKQGCTSNSYEEGERVLICVVGVYNPYGEWVGNLVFDRDKLTVDDELRGGYTISRTAKPTKFRHEEGKKSVVVCLKGDGAEVTVT